MIEVKVSSELPRGVKWSNEMTKQLPYSIANALNTTVQGSKYVPGSKQKSALNNLAGAARGYLNKDGPPKKQTQEGFRASPANKRNLITVIQPKDRLWSRNRYLSGNILGGSRAPKYDAAFINHPQAKAIPPGSRLVPTGAIKTDRYGNITRTKIANLLENVGNTNTKGGNIFIGKPRGGGRPPGVYRRERNHKLRPLFYAVSEVKYSSIFPATQVVQTTVQRRFGINLRTELDKNVANEIRRGSADLRTGILW